MHPGYLQLSTFNWGCIPFFMETGISALSGVARVLRQQRREDGRVHCREFEVASGGSSSEMEALRPALAKDAVLVINAAFSLPALHPFARAIPRRL